MKTKLIFKRGFSLIELLIVIAVIGILMSIAIPSFSKVKERARTSTCAMRLKKLGDGFLMFAQAYGNKLPTMDTNPDYSADPVPSSGSDRWQAALMKNGFVSSDKDIACPRNEPDDGYYIPDGGGAPRSRNTAQHVDNGGETSYGYNDYIGSNATNIRISVITTLGEVPLVADHVSYKMEGEPTYRHLEKANVLLSDLGIKYVDSEEFKQLRNTHVSEANNP